MRKLPDPVVEDADLDPSMLIPEQENVLRKIVDEGKNLFFTGSAGTGKSFVLKHLVHRLRKKFSKGVYMTAATGIAAVNIGGITLHSFAGIRLGQGNVDSLVTHIKKSRKYLKRWRQCNVLIIDEISMIDNHLFDKLHKVAQIIREDLRPFGGIQLVLCGDFFQLPPVKGGYIFEGQAWRECIDMCLELTTVMRQKDTKFITILNELRRGMMTDTSMLELRKCCRPLDLGDGIIPTKLYATNAAVDEENYAALQALGTESFFFQAFDKGDESVLSHLKKDCPAAENIELKVGAQVVLLRKVESLEGLVNGSRGVVVGFADSPITKSKLAPWYQQNAKLPIVRFTNGAEAAVPPIEFEVWQEERAVRLQLPLKLAWALTIHRAQGMTLDKAECKLSEAFAPGQAYVGLSRVRQLDGLYLKDFDRRAIKVSHKVLTFYKKMTRDKMYSTGAGEPSAMATVAATKADIRRGNTGSIKSFSADKGMLVLPTGQRILGPSVSKPIGLPLAFVQLNSQQAISGSFVNGSSAASGVVAAINVVTTATSSVKPLDNPPHDQSTPKEATSASSPKQVQLTSTTTTTITTSSAVTKPSSTVAKPSSTVTKPSSTVAKPSSTVTKPSSTVTTSSSTNTAKALPRKSPSQDKFKPDQYRPQDFFIPDEYIPQYDYSPKPKPTPTAVTTQRAPFTPHTKTGNGHAQNGYTHKNGQNGHAQNGNTHKNAQNGYTHKNGQNGHAQNGYTHKNAQNGHPVIKTHGHSTAPKANGSHAPFKAREGQQQTPTASGGSSAGSSIFDYLNTLAPAPKAKM